jgi:hypothetical protein
MLVEGDAIASVAKEIGKSAFALLKRLLAEIEAVELYEVEGAEHSGMVVMPIAKHVEHRKALLIDDDRLAVENTRAHRQSRHCGDDLRKSSRKIVAVVGEQSDANALARRARMRNPSCLIS